MDIIKSYKINIVQNKSLIPVFAIIAFIVRFLFYGFYDQPAIDPKTNGYLWTPEVQSFLSNNIISFAISTIFVLVIVVYLSLLNNKHKLIRIQSYLVYLFSILFFSAQPLFIYMNSQYISLLLLLICLDTLMDTYIETNASFKAYKIGFTIALASLFSFYSIIYIPIFWIGFKYMRCLNIRTLLASIIGFCTIYWIAFSFFIWQNNFEAFLNPFKHLYPILNLNINNFSPNKIIFFIISAISLITILLDYQLVAFHDKIQTRANIFFIFLICGLSFLTSIFIYYDPILYLFTFGSTLCFLVAHFFSLTDKKWKIWLFYTTLVLYVILCIYSYLSVR